MEKLMEKEARIRNARELIAQRLAKKQAGRKTSGRGAPMMYTKFHLALAGIASFAVTLAVFHCKQAKTACAVIDVVHNVCAVIRYTDPMGDVHEVQMQAEDWREFGRLIAIKQDAGVDASLYQPGDF